MRFFIAIIGNCLIAAAAAAADRTGDPAAAPWGPDSPPAAALAPRPKVVEYGSDTNTSNSKPAEITVPRQAAAAMEIAPDPPSTSHAAAPAVFQQDTSLPVVHAASAVESSAAAPIASRTSPLVSMDTLQPAPTTSLTIGGHGEKTAAAKTSPLIAMFTVGGSLSIVLGLFLAIAWALRKTAPRGSLVLPKEVFEILGRAALGARQQVQLLRCGNKLLLVSITPHGTETLTEVTDPLEVDRIAGICQQGNPKSASSAFRQVFQQLATKPDPSAEAGSLEVGGVRRKRYRWEEKHA